MSRETADNDALWPGWSEFWESNAGLGLATALVVAVGAALFFGNLADLGVWEPWEANDILVAQEYQDRPDPKPLSERDPKAPSYNWAVPTKNQKPVARSLLKTWLVGWSLSDGLDDKGEPQVGKLEFSARLPMAAGAMMLLLVGFFWLRDIFDTWSALLASLAVASTPALYFGVHTISTELLFIVTTSLAVIAFQKLAWAEDARQYLWGVAFGIALALSFLDQRIVGLLIPMATITAFGLTHLPFQRAVEVDGDLVGTREITLCIGSFLAAGAVVGWGFWRSWGVDADLLLLPWVKQLMALLIPTFVLLSGIFLAWRTRIIRRLRSPAGLIGLALAGCTAGLVLQAYSEANPTLLKHGEIVGDIPALGYALENDLFGNTFDGGHLHFAMWIRQIGFSMIPWTAFAPLGIGYLARSTRLTDEQGALRQEVLSEAESTKRLLVVWSFVGVLVIIGASIFNHYYYPGYFPLAVGAGLMLGDRDFWAWARTHNLIDYFMGFAAIAILMMLGKDLERFPPRLIESYMMFEPDVGLPEDFKFGALLDRLKYTWVFVSMTFFFGLVSWGFLTLRDAKTLPKRLWTWLKAWWAGDDGEPRGDVTPAHERARAKDDLRRSSTWYGKIARLVEAPATFGVIITAVFVASAGIFLFQVAPTLGNHLSQRGIFETYTEVKSNDEKLYRLQVSTRETSVYLRNVERLSSTGALLKKFDSSQRFFAVIPRDELSDLNADVRRRYDRNIPVLDARSSKLLLISNKLREGEDNQNFIAEAIVEDRSEIQHEVTFEKDGRQVHPTYDGQLKLIGYSLDHEGDVPAYGWGETAVLSTYFEVVNPVPTDQEIFLHVDYPGSRIHGDHKPVGGDYPTSDWVEGDIVKDVHRLKIDPYSTTGTYTMYFGFYRAGRRMEVQPRSAHDGKNRVPMGRIEVTGF